MIHYELKVCIAVLDLLNENICFSSQHYETIAPNPAVMLVGPQLSAIKVLLQTIVSFHQGFLQLGKSLSLATGA